MCNIHKIIQREIRRKIMVYNISLLTGPQTPLDYNSPFRNETEKFENLTMLTTFFPPV